VSADAMLALAREALMLAFLLAAPVVLSTLLVGIVVGVLQAVTQVQDQAVGLAPRLIAAGVALALAAPWIGAQLVRFTERVFSAIPA
jgi:flagellar biosynthesis protein FliQ